jgi:hypothetical protein
VERGTGEYADIRTSAPNNVSAGGLLRSSKESKRLNNPVKLRGALLNACASAELAAVPEKTPNWASNACCLA